uniref:Phospholipid/glycerol acyltransferase domain-containing protein n=1 Tax=Lotharella globosa TaxID=91324 RepID=A0A7S4DHE5_9EUKA
MLSHGGSHVPVRMGVIVLGCAAALVAMLSLSKTDVIGSPFTHVAVRSNYLRPSGAALLGRRSRSNLACRSAAEIKAITKQSMDVLKQKTEGTPMGPMVQILEGFMNEYADTNIQANTPASKYQEIVSQSMMLMGDALAKPHQFEILHRAIREPFDYYRWGVEFFRPLIELETSKIHGVENLAKVVDYIEKGENVILLSNHQTEVDPQAIEILLENSGCSLASELIFVAGHKVTTDPLAIPFSLGQNLLCIHSKKYIENPPEKKAEKQAHNTKTMKKMQSLLEDGGTFLWVAPSGGRDRPDPETREFVVAPFDDRSVQMFRLMAQKAKMASGKKTHFFPMAMLTHELVPPPDGIKAAVGEKRSAKRGAANIWFGDEVTEAQDEGLSNKQKQAKFYEDVVSQVDDKYNSMKDARFNQLQTMSEQKA